MLILALWPDLAKAKICDTWFGNEGKWLFQRFGELETFSGSLRI